MSYNESLKLNSNYPLMSQSEWDNSPMAENNIEHRLNVLCRQTLNKITSISTTNYNVGIDKEDDGEGGIIGVHFIDTDNVNFEEEYKEQHLTPLNLIKKFKSLLLDYKVGNISSNPCIQHINYYIKECSDWCEDECTIIEE